MKITMEAGVCPWNADHRLVRIGLKAREIPTDKLPESNLVFLIDVSGSMWGPTRLDLVKSSLKLLVNNLREKDKVAIVVYAATPAIKLESTPGSDKQKIRDAIDELTSVALRPAAQVSNWLIKWLNRTSFLKETIGSFFVPMEISM